MYNLKFKNCYHLLKPFNCRCGFSSDFAVQVQWSIGLNSLKNG